MKRKDILFPALAILGGGLGFGLRMWQLGEAYIPEYQLFYTGHPATILLMLLIAALAAFFLVYVRGAKGAGGDFQSAFHAPASGYMTLMTIAALLFFAAGLLGLMETMNQLLLYQAYPGVYPPSLFISLLLCAVLAFLSVPGTLLVGKVAYRGQHIPAVSRMVVFPAACGLVWLFSIHLANGTNPVLMDYGFGMAAAACLMLSQYYVAGYFHDRPCLRRALFFALMGIPLGMIAVADASTYFDLALLLSFCLFSLATAWVLLRNCFGPAWPERTPQDEDDLDTDDE